MISIRAFLVLLFLASTSLTTFAQVTTVCTCADVNDLINRLNMAEAAIETYKEEIPVIEQKEKADGKPLMAADPIASLKAGRLTSDYDVLQGKVEENIEEHQTAGAKICSGETTKQGDECVSRVKNCGSACLEETILKHENFHRLACNIYLRSGKAGIIGSRFMDMRLVDVAQEEITAYQEEIKWIVSVLKSLPKQCRPSGWVGSFYVKESRIFIRHENLPPTSVRVSGSVDTKNNFTRTALILYRDQPVARVTLEENDSKTTVSHQHWPCESSLGAPKPLHDINSTVVETVEAHGKATDIVPDLSFDYDSTGGQYAIYLTVPGVTGEISGTRHEESSGNCNPADDQPKNDSIPPHSQTYDSTQIPVEGTAQPGAKTLSGSKTIDLAPGVTLPDATMTNTITVSWHLFNID